jgi:ribosomal protein S17
MKHAVRLMLAAGAIAVGLAACKSKAPEIAQQPSAPAPVTPGAPSGDMPAGHPPVGGESGAAPGGAMAPAGKMFTGTVLETMNAANYTYVQVDNGTEKIWAAAPQFDVKKGDKVTVPEGMPMQNYESKTLNKKFDVVYFVGAIGKGDQPPAGASGMGMGMGAPGAPGAGGAVPEQLPMPEGAHPKMDASQAAKDAGVTFTGIKKADKTVGEIYAGQSGLSGKDVTVRGKVVKFSPQIMGKNWIHVQDGTGTAPGNDLTVTTADGAKVGDTVLVSGKITLKKDFGMGYKYDLIIEDGKVKVE